MDKLELWKKNEPLFHSKLNESVEAINELISADNSKNDIEGSGNSTTLPLFDEYKEQIAEMFANDGEGIILSGNITYFVGEAGLYARENGASTIGKNYFPCAPCLKKIIDYSCLNDGGVLYQKIYEKDGELKSCLKYGHAMACVPTSSSTTIYKRLSRIVMDCKAYQCGKKPIFKAIAVNDTFVDFASGSSGNAKEYDVRAGVENYYLNFIDVEKVTNNQKTTFYISTNFDFDPFFFDILDCNGRRFVTLKNVEILCESSC